jgi:asparagine synthase (glutamine-hydrolysing)
MCGFVTVIGERARVPGLIEKGLAAIAHRGPDGHGIWRSQNGSAAMGHARLAIIDLSQQANQPMLSADRKGVIAFNGEIYNYRDLVGYVKGSLRSTSDTEVLVELLRDRGANALPLLRGMFAFAYWDGEELLLVRDRLGIKPLFYAATSEQAAAGSEIGALLAMGTVAGEPDPRAIDDYLTYLYVPHPRTGIVGLSELPPGCLLRWRRGCTPRVERYWSVPTAAPAKTPTAHEVREILDEAVKVHLVSDVPVGVFLSGGLDSSSITALASRHVQGVLKTFTVTFGDEGAYLDERKFARQIASHYGTAHTEIGVQANAAQILPELVKHFGQPFGNPTAVLSYALSRETRRYVKVALAGDGGDEVLGGYPRYAGAWFAESYRHVPRRVHALIRRGAGPLFSRSNERGRLGSRVVRFLGNADVPTDEMYFRWVTYHGTLAKEKLFVNRRGFLNGQLPANEYEFLCQVRRRHAARSLRDAAPLTDIESFLPQNVLRYGDCMSMAHALEVRVPFCDHLVVERLAPMALSSKMPGFVPKGLFRWAMKDELPGSIVLHRKVGFNPPIAAWLRQELAPVVSDYLGTASVRRRGWFRPDAVARVRTGFESGVLDAAYTLWSLVVLEAWARWLETAGQTARAP